MSKMVTGKGHGKAKKSSHRISHMMVEPAANGATVKTHFHPKKMAGGGSGMDAMMGGMAPPPQTHVFGNADDAGAHVAQQLAQNPAAAEGEPDADDMPQKA